MLFLKNTLDQFGAKVGEDLAIYDEAERTIYFFHHGEEGYRLRMKRGKRKRKTKVRPDDVLIRINFDGTVSHGIDEIEEFEIATE